MQAAEEYEQKIAQVTECSYTRLKIMMAHTEDDPTMPSADKAFVKTGENFDDLSRWLVYFLCSKSVAASCSIFSFKISRSLTNLINLERFTMLTMYAAQGSKTFDSL